MVWYRVRVLESDLNQIVSPLAAQETSVSKAKLSSRKQTNVSESGQKPLLVASGMQIFLSKPNASQTSHISRSNVL